MMKHKLLNFLLLLMLFISAPRIVAADANDWNITTKLAGQAFTPATYLAFGSDFDGGYMLYRDGNAAKQIAVSNGVIYAITPGQPYWNNTANNQIEIYNSYGGFQKRSALDSGCGLGSSGRGIAADDNGNIIYAYTSNCDCKIGSIAVLKNSGEYGVAVSVDTRKTIPLGVYTKELNQITAKPDWYTGLSGRTDFFYASGNVYDGTGYMWFTDGVEVVRITIENVDGTQTATKQDVYPISGTGFVVPTGEFHESRIKPYGNDCFLLQNETGVYDCKLVDNVMQVVQVIRGTDYKLHASNIFNFHGHKILVLDQWANATYGGIRDGQLNIIDMNTDDISGNGSIAYNINAMTGSFVSNGMGNDVTFTELDGDDDANIDTWCEFELDPNQNQLHLYTYCQGVGFAKFTINAEGETENPIEKVTATLVTHEDHQDATITWDPVSENPENTQYKVYYQVKPYTETIDGIVNLVDQYSEWKELVTTEANVTTARHENLKWLLVTTESAGTNYYERTYRYKVVPADGSYAANKEMDEVVPALVTHAPLWLSSQSGDVKGYGVQTFSGYSQVQLMWTYPDKALDATGYDILRDGVVINANPIQTFVYVDFDVTTNRDHVYQVRARYGDKYSESTQPITVTAQEIAQDDAKYQYKIDEIYNYPIDNNDGVNDGAEVMAGVGYENLGQNRSQQEAYRQASYDKGYWYIAQNHLTNDGVYPTDGTGALFRISASDPKSESTTDREGNILSAWTKLGTEHSWAFKQRTNFGVAVDDAGNLFTIGTLTSAYGTYESTSITSGGTLSKGLLFQCWGIGGGYSDPWVIEFQDESGNVIDFTEYGVEDADGTRNIGRVDYYYMDGNVFSAEGGYLYLAPTKTTAVYKFYLSSNSAASGTTKIATLVNKYSYTDDNNTINPATGNAFGTGNECYAFPVDGRDDIVFNLRSNAYFNVNSDFTSSKTIYGARSRVNNAGGCTIQFNDELFLITPQNQYSQNSGNFYVGMATRELKSNGEYATADEADLSQIVPAAVFYQDENAEAQYRFVNGVWLFAELGLLDGRSLWEFEGAGLEVPEAECVYIYMYVPGVRFAKYRLTPETALPTPNVGISVYPVYKDANGNEGYREGEGGKELGNVNEKYVEIDRFVGEVSFEPIQDFGASSGSRSFVINGYQLTLFDKYGNVVMPAEGYDADDNTTDGIINIRHNNIAPVGGYKIYYPDLDRSENNSYTAKLVALFSGVSGINKGKDLESVPALSEADNTYVPMAPAGQAVVYRSLQWGDWDADFDGKPSFDKDGNPVLPDAGDVYWDVYQVAMNIEEPNFEETGKNEPVSYYTIHVAKTDGENWTGKYDAEQDVESEWVKDIMLYVGKGNSLDGVAADAYGYVDCGALYGGKIPGTHEFMSKGETPKDTPDVYWFEKYYMGYYEGAAGTEYEIKTPDVVNDRKYYVVAHYAAGTPQKITEIATLSTEGNSKIYAQRHATLTAAVTHENLPTGVEDIELTANISVYPIPATVSITIKCAEAIENVEIYSLTGVKVKEFAGEGEQIMTIAVDDMEAGYYMLRVNDNAPIKILKK